MYENNPPVHTKPRRIAPPSKLAVALFLILPTVGWAIARAVQHFRDLG